MLGASIMRKRAQDELMEAKATLERRVIERTSELQEEVAAEDLAHAEFAAAQQRLIELSRQAGMAEVATGVLHNVGNVLNSVNVAATILVEKLQQSRVAKLVSVSGLLKVHETDLTAFLTSDPKGGHVLPYLSKLARHLAQERDGMMSELGRLSSHVGHIKEIVAAQQGYATTAGFIEKTSIQKLIEDALAISKNGLDRDDVAVHRHFSRLPAVYTDKHKVLQIVLICSATRGMPPEPRGSKVGRSTFICGQSSRTASSWWSPITESVCVRRTSNAISSTASPRRVAGTASDSTQAHSPPGTWVVD